jgi:TonB-linked SusC/RagA family outer membrane protein
MQTESFGFASEQLPNELLGIYGLDQGIPYSPVAEESSNGLVSFFSRLNYVYDSRYVATFSYRADGSSKFADAWGYFPSGGLAWNIHNENFMKNVKAVSQLKLRSTYGISGNNRIGDFDRLAILELSTNGYSFNNGIPVSAVVPARIANEALRWEVTAQLDLGLDIGLFDNRLQMTVDYYNKKTTDLLLDADLSPSLGFSSAVKNVGSLRNEGLELAINTVNVSNRDFQWTSSFNISFNRNKILALNDGQRFLANRVNNFESQFSAPLYISEVGKSAGMFYGLVYDGLYQVEDFENPAPGVYILKDDLPSNGTPRQDIRPGDVKYKDLNGDGTVDNYDLTVIGRGLPVHVGGFSNNFTWRNFSLNIFLQWSYGNDIYNANRIPFEGNSNGRQNLNQFASYVDRWSFENQDAANFRVGGGGPTGRHSSRVLEDGSYLRFKTVSFSYSLPDRLLKKLRFSSLEFNVSAQNLITFTHYSGMDPEVSVRNSVLTPGFDYSAYPMARTVVFGINAGF